MLSENTEDDQVVRRRILSVAGANLIGQIVNAAGQLVTIGLFVVYWSDASYADWLKLYTIPGLFAIATTGFGSVAVNELTIEMGKGRRQHVETLFQTTFWLIVAVTLTVILLVALTPTSIVRSFFGITSLNTLQIKLMLYCFAIQFGLQQLIAFAGGCFRSLRFVFRGVMWGNAIRLMIVVVTVSVLLAGGSPLELAAGMSITLLISVSIMMWQLACQEPTYRPKIIRPCWITLRRLIVPSFLFNSIPLSHAVRQQVTILIIGRLVSDQAVVSFNAMRTLSNLVIQVIGLSNSAMQPEISIAFGANNIIRMQGIHRRCCQICIWLSGLAMTALFLVGPKIFNIWTSGQIEFDSVTFNLLLLVIGVNTLWMTSGIVALATNRHQKFAWGYLAVTLLFSCISVLLVNSFGLAGAPISLLLSDLVMLTLILPQSMVLTDDSFRGFLGALVRVRATA